MRVELERLIFTVTRADGGWCVEYDGPSFGHSADKEVSKAAAARRAREMQDSGRPCQVRVHGEHGFWGA